jgi:excisionase family DNA binding protein
VSSEERLYDPDRVVVGTGHAIERARSRGVETVEPDDLLAGMLLAVSRFGIVELGTRAVDLFDLGLRFDLPSPDVTIKPRYASGAAAVFDRAVRIARTDGSTRLAPIHLLVALADPAYPLFARLLERCAIDEARWRRLLAAVTPPTATAPSNSTSARSRAASPGSPMPDDLDALLTPDEAARALGVHIQTLRGYIRCGRLPAFRVAGERAIRIRRDDLRALLEHLRVAPAHADP